MVGHWEKQRSQHFELDFAEWGTSGDSAPDGGGGAGDVLDDFKYAEAIEFVADQGRASNLNAPVSFCGKVFHISVYLRIIRKISLHIHLVQGLLYCSEQQLIEPILKLRHRLCFAQIFHAVIYARCHNIARL